MTMDDDRHQTKMMIVIKRPFGEYITSRLVRQTRLIREKRAYYIELSQMLAFNMQKLT